MKSSQFTRIAAAVTVSVCALSTAPAYATSFTSLVVIGDSLSDGGNAANVGRYDPTQVITGNTYIPDNAYAPRTLSNGPVWATNFAGLLGLPLTPSVIPGSPPSPIGGGLNFAFASARSTGGVAPSLTVQSDLYRAVSGGVADPTGLYIVQGGGNDARDALDAITGGEDLFLAAGKAGAKYALDVGKIVDQLQADGAKNIVVWNVPNAGLAPAVAAAAGGTLAGELVGGTMSAYLAERLDGEVGVTIFDTFSFITAAYLNPSAFGFTNVADACGAISGANCDQYLFWDGIHPTAAMHRALAGAVYAQVVPEPETYALFALGLVAVGWAARRRSAQA